MLNMKNIYHSTYLTVVVMYMIKNFTHEKILDANISESIVTMILQSKKTVFDHRFSKTMFAQCLFFITWVIHILMNIFTLNLVFYFRSVMMLSCKHKT